MVDISILQISCEGQGLTPSRGYRLTLSSGAIVIHGLRTTKSPKSKYTSNKVSWTEPFGASFNSSLGVPSGSDDGPRITISLLRVRCLRRPKTVQSWMVDIPISEGLHELEPSPLPGDSKHFSGTLKVEIRVLKIDVQATVRDVKKNLDEMQRLEAPPLPTSGGPNEAEAMVNTLKSYMSPVIDQTNAWEVLFGLLDKLDKVMTQIHPWVSLAWGVASQAYKIVRAQSDRDQSVSNLVVEMAKSVDLIHGTDDLKRSEHGGTIITRIMQQVVQCAYFVRDYSKELSFARRTVTLAFSQVNKQIEAYKSNLVTLREDLQQNLAVHTAVKVHRLLDFAEEAKEQIWVVKDKVDAAFAFQLLGEMAYSTSAGVDFKGAKDPKDIKDICLPGTRKEVLNLIVRWVSGFDPANLEFSNKDNEVPHPSGEWAVLRPNESSRVLWICGDQGSGKTALVRTVAEHFFELSRLGSFYAFSQGYPAETHPGNVFSTIARDIADLDQLRQDRLLAAIRGSTSVRRTTNCTRQFDNFIVTPSEALPSVGEILVVIDALDESGDEAGRAELVKLLTVHAHKLPPNFRVLVTSRLEPDIQVALDSRPPGVDVLRMDRIPKELTRGDITTYLEHELHNVIEPHQQQADFKDSVNKLTKKAECLFQWAATACRSISGSDDPMKQMGVALEAGEGLDGLYEVILHPLVELHENQAPLRLILSYVAYAHPLSLRTLVELASDQEEGNAEEALATQLNIARQLAAVLDGTGSADSLIAPHHPSFRDFLRRQDHNSPYYVDYVEANTSIALSCLRAMKDGLKFNIYQLDTSFKRNQDIRKSDESINTKTTPCLLYACRYWTYHLSRLPKLEAFVASKVIEFFQHRFLQWLEVMSMSESSFQGALTLLREAKVSSPELRSLIRNATLFASSFSMAIATSVPHIYLSALAFAPVSSMFEHYQRKFPRSATLTRGRFSQWLNPINIMEGHTNAVKCAAFSPDGSKIASCSKDGTIRFWDTRTGEEIGDTLKGHNGPVTAVAFSPDGLRIVSGSHDATLRQWSSTTGDSIGMPIRGHMGPITCVIFSVDGGEIVSGSGDETIRFWKAENGTFLRQIYAHQDVITCVAFSPNGARLLSCSNDYTIRIWDTVTLESVGETLRGHSDYVTSACFSPDGGQIVSSSFDKTLRRWDAVMGTPIGAPLEGHTKPVVFVAFTPDGDIVSGSWDNTIRMWDASTGALVERPLQGHTKQIAATAVSLDGSLILSASYDNTLRLWGMVALPEVDENLKSHTQSATSLAFFPDGKKLASASGCTVRLWDVERGTIIDPPLRGHDAAINCVNVSPDGRWIVSGSEDKTLRLWEAETGDHVPIRDDAEITSVAFSRDSRQIASGSSDGTVYFWDIDSSLDTRISFKAHNTRVHSVSYSPDSDRVATASLEHVIRLWNATTGDNIMDFQEHDAIVTCMTFSPDGTQLLSGSQVGPLQLWDVTSGKTVGKPFRGHSEAVVAVAFSPDGTQFVSGSNDTSARVWGSTMGKSIGEPMIGHTGPVTSVAFSPDGRCIATASRDKAVRMWNLDWENTVRESQYPTILSSTRTFTLTNGWILGSKGELILWIPPVHRDGLCYPNSQCLGARHITELDFSNYKCGSRWKECRDEVEI